MESTRFFHLGISPLFPCASSKTRAIGQPQLPQLDEIVRQRILYGKRQKKVIGFEYVKVVESKWRPLLYSDCEPLGTDSRSLERVTNAFQRLSTEVWNGLERAARVERPDTRLAVWRLRTSQAFSHAGWQLLMQPRLLAAVSAAFPSSRHPAGPYDTLGRFAVNTAALLRRGLSPSWQSLLSHVHEARVQDWQAVWLNRSECDSHPAVVSRIGYAALGHEVYAPCEIRSLTVSPVGNEAVVSTEHPNTLKSSVRAARCFSVTKFVT
jgi:hypothetical protein